MGQARLLATQVAQGMAASRPIDQPTDVQHHNCQKRRGQAYENRRLEGSHECYPSSVGGSPLDLLLRLLLST